MDEHLMIGIALFILFLIGGFFLFCHTDKKHACKDKHDDYPKNEYGGIDVSAAAEERAKRTKIEDRHVDATMKETFDNACQQEEASFDGKPTCVTQKDKTECNGE